MMNHYLKVPQYAGTSIWDKKLDRYSSQILNYLDVEELKTVNQVKLMLLYDQNYDTGLRNLSTDYSNISQTLDELTKEGFAKKIYGKALAKALAGV